MWLPHVGYYSQFIIPCFWNQWRGSAATTDSWDVRCRWARRCCWCSVQLRLEGSMCRARRCHCRSTPCMPLLATREWSQAPWCVHLSVALTWHQTFSLLHLACYALARPASNTEWNAYIVPHLATARGCVEVHMSLWGDSVLVVALLFCAGQFLCLCSVRGSPQYTTPSWMAWTATTHGTTQLWTQHTFRSVFQSTTLSITRSWSRGTPLATSTVPSS